MPTVTGAVHSGVWQVKVTLPWPGVMSDAQKSASLEVALKVVTLSHCAAAAMTRSASSVSRLTIARRHFWKMRSLDST